MKKQYSFKVFMVVIMLICSTVCWGQEDNKHLWFDRYEMALFSDSIHEVSSLLGSPDLRIYADSLIYLDPDAYHYVQITNKPVYLICHDTQDDKYFWMYPYDYFYEMTLNEETDYWEPSSEYYFGTWTPSNSTLCSQIGKKDGWWERLSIFGSAGSGAWWYPEQYFTSYNVSTSAQPYEYQWWTFDNYNEEIYTHFKMEPGLYYVKTYAGLHYFASSVVLEMRKLKDLKEGISPRAYPRITSEVQQKKESVNVSSIYDNIYVTGKNWYEWTSNGYYIFDEDVKIHGGEYEDYYCKRLGDGGRWYIQPPASMYSSGYYKIDSAPQPDIWYNLTYSDSFEYFQFPNWTNWTGGRYVIWDVKGERVMFIKEDKYTNEINDYIGIVNSISAPEATMTPYAPDTYFNLQGIPVESPQSGQIYIKNGKKILYK